MNGSDIRADDDSESDRLTGSERRSEAEVLTGIRDLLGTNAGRLAEFGIHAEIDIRASGTGERRTAELQIYFLDESSDVRDVLSAELYGPGLVTVSPDRILSDLREDLEDVIEKLKPELHTCAVCGYLGLLDSPWKGGSPSDEICPSCGIQFGYNDWAGGDLERRQQTHRDWRERWKAGGCRWDARTIPPPPGWDPHEQLKRVEGTPRER